MNTKRILLSGIIFVTALMLFSFALPSIQFSAHTNAASGGEMIASVSAQGNTVASLNWGGYVAYADSSGTQHTVSSVSGSWVVQSVQSNHKDVYSAQWIGIGGYFSGDSSLIQTGTSSNSGGGSTTYNAWWELLPSAETVINGMTVSPGDLIQSHIFLVSGSYGSAQTWDIYLNDTSLGEHFFKQVSYSSSMLSAEWIEERPAISGSLTTLANFGTADYGQAYTAISGTNAAVIGGTSGSISSFSHTNLTMVKRNGSVLSTPGPLTGNGTSFQMYYGTGSSTGGSGGTGHGGGNGGGHGKP